MRITDPKQLETLSPEVRAQLEPELKRSAEQATEAESQGRARRRYLEEREGRRLVTWIDGQHIDHPEIGRICLGDYFAHMPNGLARSATEGGIFKAQGLRRDWPDYLLDLPWTRADGRWYAGLRLELKPVDSGRPDDGQLAILRRLERVGYYARVCWGAVAAARDILGYVGITGAAAEARLQGL